LGAACLQVQKTNPHRRDSEHNAVSHSHAIASDWIPSYSSVS
jgi:hypothetical protein